MRHRNRNLALPAAAGITTTAADSVLRSNTRRPTAHVALPAGRKIAVSIVFDVELCIETGPDTLVFQARSPNAAIAQSQTLATGLKVRVHRALLSIDKATSDSQRRQGFGVDGRPIGELYKNLPGT